VVLERLTGVKHQPKVRDSAEVVTGREQQRAREDLSVNLVRICGDNPGFRDAQNGRLGEQLRSTKVNG
jgi:hypothetical protein